MQNNKPLPKDVPILFPETCENVTIHGNKDLVDMIRGS